MNSTIQQNYKERMDTIFLNSEVLTLTDKINLKRSDTFIPLSNLSIYYKWKKWKNHTKKINSKYQHQHGLNWNYLMIQYYIEYILKNMRQLLIILQ